MKKSRFTESQIAAISREGAAGVPAAEVIARGQHLSIQRACRTEGRSRTGFYRVPKASAEPDAADFMHDTLYDGRRLRTLNVLDDGNRQALGIEITSSIPSQRAIRVTNQLIEYNEQQPHDSLGRVPPLTYLPREITVGESSFRLST